VRLTPVHGFYQKALSLLDIKVIFTPPYHPQSNGLCERTNRSFLQNIRVLSKQLKTVDWPSLCPLAAVINNSQISVKTGFSPSELFLARPPLLINPIIDSETTPLVRDWVQHHLNQQEPVTTRLEKLRQVSLKRQNRRRKPHNFTPWSYVLVHKDRFPRHPHRKIDSPWLVPYKILKVAPSSLVVFASPSLGGIISVPISMCKIWSDLIESDDSTDSEDDLSPEIDEFGNETYSPIGDLRITPQPQSDPPLNFVSPTLAVKIILNMK